MSVKEAGVTQQTVHVWLHYLLFQTMQSLAGPEQRDDKHLGWGLRLGRSGESCSTWPEHPPESGLPCLLSSWASDTACARACAQSGMPTLRSSSTALLRPPPATSMPSPRQRLPSACVQHTAEGCQAKSHRLSPIAHSVMWLCWCSTHHSKTQPKQLQYKSKHFIGVKAMSNMLTNKASCRRLAVSTRRVDTAFDSKLLCRASTWDGQHAHRGHRHGRNATNVAAPWVSLMLTEAETWQWESG